MGVVSRDKNTSAILFDAKSKLVECKGVLFFQHSESAKQRWWDTGFFIAAMLLPAWATNTIITGRKQAIKTVGG